MTDAAKLRTRAATPADASAIAAIYNEGIADRIATFETEPRSATDIASSARSPLPDIPGQENGGGGTGQAGEPAGAEAQRPGGELRRPAELVERDAE